MGINVIEFEVEMKRHFDTGATLSKALNITPASFSKKKTGRNDFTLPEIKTIIDRYELSSDRVMEIFFV